jgi:limonene-1,2-epoxide hydrolase
MPWFPDFVGAVELARRETRAAGQADPVALYLAALDHGQPDDLEDAWPGEIVVYDPRAGEIRGHHALQRFVRRNQSWLGERRARIDTVAATAVGGRAVVELMAYLRDEGDRVSWPVAVVAESTDDRSVVFRTYCSQVAVDGRRHVRPPILTEQATLPDGVVAGYHAALAAGDAASAVAAFATDGYLQESSGGHRRHRGPRELRDFFDTCFGSGGGIGLELCAVTDDGVRCAVEYNCTRWGSHDLPPQAGLAVCERGVDGRLAAVRIYDDVEAPLAV